MVFWLLFYLFSLPQVNLARSCVFHVHSTFLKNIFKMSVGLAIARGGAFLMASFVVCAFLWNILPKKIPTPEAMTYENRPPPRPPLVVNSQPVVNRQVATTSSDTKLHRRAQCMPLLERINSNIVKPYSYLKFDRAMRKVKRVLDVCPRPFANTKRLVFVDIGSNAYMLSAITGGSTKSFQGWYPRGNEFIVHNFEPLIQFFNIINIINMVFRSIHKYTTNSPFFTYL